AATVLVARWPGVTNLGDITQVDWARVPPVDIVCGGFPCQSVSSVAFGAEGIKENTRSGLWEYQAKAIGVLRPRWAVIENVRGLTSAPATPNPTRKGHNHDTLTYSPGPTVDSILTAADAPVAGSVGVSVGGPGPGVGDMADMSTGFVRGLGRFMCPGLIC
ncbi:MAG: DNA cytosine methyltransferase, partial [Bifidobacteriaceae bacterium]|nr:DNA cytosine methyltransferase [Bifidobacteriaceae bacterium]